MDTQKVLSLLQDQGGEMPLTELIATLKKEGVELRLQAIRTLKQKQVLCIIPGNEATGQATTTVALIY